MTADAGEPHPLNDQEPKDGLDALFGPVDMTRFIRGRVHTEEELARKEDRIPDGIYC